MSFLTISRTVTRRFLRNLAKWQGNESATFWKRSHRHPDPD